MKYKFSIELNTLEIWQSDILNQLKGQITDEKKDIGKTVEEFLTVKGLI